MNDAKAADRLFREYRRTRDPERIAAVFDLTAPRLLRLAIHLVGSADDAEDLVQATFLAAIERAGDFDPRREVLPWLSGILGNKARYARRAAAREVDPERLAERIERTPLEAAEDVELSGALAEALDRLEEPYRRVLILRVRHGMKPADIAHALDESPGTVRVQLHRGTEKLRRLLPAGFAAPALLLIEPTRGLAAVREAVVAEAQAVFVAGTTSLTLGGLLMTKKTAVVIAAVLVAVAAGTWNRWGEAPDAGRASAEPAPAGVLAESKAADALPAAPTVEPVAARPERAALADAPPDDRVQLRGRVVDAVTGAAVAGARVELFAPEKLVASEIKEAAYDVIRQQNYNGSIFALGAWPHVPGEWWETGRDLDATEHSVYGRPAKGRALGNTVSGSDGRFELPAPPDGGTLVCAHDDYAPRVVPATVPANEWTIELRAGHRLFGRVVEQGATAEPVERELAILFWGEVGTRWSVDEGGSPVETPAFGTWGVTTEPDGSFDVRLPCERVQAYVLSPGFLFESGMSWETGGGEPARLYVRRVPGLHVVDAATGKGIENFYLVGREAGEGYPRWTGRFYARDGVFQMFNDAMWTRELANKPFGLTVWADGYREARLRFTDLPSEEAVVARLERGSLPAVRGRVLDGGEPIAGALCRLQPYYELQWNLEDSRSVAAQRSDADGAFELAAPEGGYLLRVQAGERTYAHAIELPRDAERIVDFAALGEIVVTVRDSDGVLQPDHTVVLGDATGRNDWRATDARGEVVFDDLADGDYRVSAPRVSTKTTFGDAVRKDVSVVGGGRTYADVEVPAAGEPRYARVATEPEVDLAGWRARTSELDWVDLEPDGRVPIDLRELNHLRFEVAAGDGRRWNANVPDDAPDGYAIRIALDGPRYVGVLLDVAGGGPLAGVRLSAFPAEEGPAPPSWPSAVTDGEGRFAIACERDVPHRITFNDQPERRAWVNHYGELGGVTFAAAGAPSAGEIEIRVPLRRDGLFRGLGERKLRGRVVRELTAEAVAGARVWVTAVDPQEHGAVELWSDATLCNTDAEGAYEVVLPEVARYRVNVYEAGFGKSALTRVLESPAEELDLILP